MIKLSTWGWLFLAVALIPSLLFYRSLGLKRMIVPIILIALAYKAGAR